MKRKICILTQPLYNGCGGLLQNFALQTVLKRMGHDVLTEDRKKNSTKRERVVFWLKAFLAPIYGPLLRPFTHVYYSSNKITKLINAAPTEFKKKYIKTTEPIYSNNKEKFKKYNFDTYIVGSDQVWRPKYSFGEGSLYNYFLDFTKDLDVKRIAFSASFGVTDWEFSEDETQRCAELLRLFDAVSVREEDGINLCKNFFGVDVLHTLDPTLLLDKTDYEALVNDANERHYKRCVFSYFLDSTPQKIKTASYVAKKLGVNVESIMPTEYYYNVGKKGLNQCIYPSVTKWLRAYMDAEFIITDSFHGTVFAIIFNKQFIAIGNADRGLSRFTSLLKTFGLENRLVTDCTRISDKLLDEHIEYSQINQIKEIKKTEALKFLRKALS